jgi:hypothetical protein
MHVDETRTDDESGGNLYNDRTVGGQLVIDAGNTVAVDEDVSSAVDPVGGIDDTPSLKQPLHFPLRPREGTARPS